MQTTLTLKLTALIKRKKYLIEALGLGFYMFFQFSKIPMATTSILLFLVLVGNGPLNNAFSQILDEDRITIELVPNSSARFFQCHSTPTNGTSSLSGLNAAESAQNVLTDSNPNTAIMGDARFSIHFSEPLVNLPGPELKVIELAGTESFNASVDVPHLGVNSILMNAKAGNGTNDCNYRINEALIDLTQFGIPEGTSVKMLSFDNLGKEDTLLGADLADIITLEATRNAKSNSSIDTATISLEGKTIPENDYIPLYDSTPFKIMNGHITANLPCTDDNSTDVNVLIGQIPDLVQAKLEPINSLSIPGDLCAFNADIASNDSSMITDIAIQNNSTDDLELPEGSNIIITAEVVSTT